MNSLGKIALSVLLLGLASTAQARDRDHYGQTDTVISLSVVSGQADYYYYDQDEEYRERLLRQQRKEDRERSRRQHENDDYEQYASHNNWGNDDYYQQRPWYEDKQYHVHTRYCRHQHNRHWDD